jgi:hypothetical protein
MYYYIMFLLNATFWHKYQLFWMATFNIPLERTFIYVEHELYIKLLLVVKNTIFDPSST